MAVQAVCGGTRLREQKPSAWLRGQQSAAWLRRMRRAGARRGSVAHAARSCGRRVDAAAGEELSRP
ncbi:hypothetical protein [Streptomyces sp. YIM S03343]